MDEKQPAMVIFTDGAIEQLTPLSIAFYEQLIRQLSGYTEQLKGKAVFAPPIKPEQAVAEA